MRVLDPVEAWEEGDVENPELIRVGDRYLLFYSASWWDTDRYRTAVADCSSPVGPCRNRRQVLVSDSEVSGPGGASLAQDRSGHWWIAYHAWVGRTRALHVDPIDVTAPVPIIDSSRSSPRTLPVAGALDVAESDGGKLRVAGWAIDRDDAQPVRVRVVADEREIATFVADDYRQDVARLGPTIGGSHGFDSVVTLSTTTPPRRVCLHALDDGARDVSIACRSTVVWQSAY
jgi:hypothetical protein